MKNAAPSGPYILTRAAQPLPLVVDSPHSGRDYPADFGYSCPTRSPATRRR
ncbi:MAG: N-formylglutamate amidohydrolase [Alphaproteobacteria bacterium]|nr:N-formylglutamate amidohydrolase [Alphaproteobacteria bacterium]